MTMSIDGLQRFLGDANRQQEYRDFVQRSTDNPSSVSNAETAQRYSELFRHAPPELVEQAFDYAFQQLPQHDRHALAAQLHTATQDPSRPFDGYTYSDPQAAADPQSMKRMLSQAAQQDPDLIGKLLGPDSPLNTPLGHMLLSAAVAYLVNRLLGNQTQGGTSGAQQPAGGLGDLIGKILSGQQSGEQSNQQPAGGLGDLIGQILGGLAHGGTPGIQSQGHSSDAPPAAQEPQSKVLGSLRKDEPPQRSLKDS
jgi:hypothetical protein